MSQNLSSAAVVIGALRVNMRSMNFENLHVEHYHSNQVTS